MDTPVEMPAESPVSKITTSDAWFTVILAGELDMSCEAQLGAMVDAFRSEGCPAARIDLSAVTFMDSTALGALARVMKIAKSRGGTVTLVQPTRNCRELLGVVGFDQAFTIESEGSSAAD